MTDLERRPCDSATLSPHSFKDMLAKRMLTLRKFSKACTRLIEKVQGRASLPLLTLVSFLLTVSC